ncbi:MAG: hypothetical protein AAF467_12610 [Actinomycetota bacterium]
MSLLRRARFRHTFHIATPRWATLFAVLALVTTSCELDVTALPSDGEAEETAYEIDLTIDDQTLSEVAAIPDDLRTLIEAMPVERYDGPTNTFVLDDFESRTWVDANDPEQQRATVSIERTRQTQGDGALRVQVPLVAPVDPIEEPDPSDGDDDEPSTEEDVTDADESTADEDDATSDEQGPASDDTDSDEQGPASDDTDSDEQGPASDDTDSEGEDESAEDDDSPAADEDGADEDNGAALDTLDAPDAGATADEPDPDTAEDAPGSEELNTEANDPAPAEDDGSEPDTTPTDSAGDDAAGNETDEGEGDENDETNTEVETDAGDDSDTGHTDAGDDAAGNEGEDDEPETTEPLPAVAFVSTSGPLPTPEDWSDHRIVTLDVHLEDDPAGPPALVLELTNSAGVSAQVPMLPGREIGPGRNDAVIFPLAGHGDEIEPIDPEVLADVEKVSVGLLDYHDRQAAGAATLGTLRLHLDALRLDGAELWDAFEGPGLAWAPSTSGTEAAGVSGTVTAGGSAGALTFSWGRLGFDERPGMGTNRVWTLPDEGDWSQYTEITAVAQSTLAELPLTWRLHTADGSSVDVDATIEEADAWTDVVWSLPAAELAAANVVALQLLADAPHDPSGDGGTVHVDDLRIVRTHRAPLEVTARTDGDDVAITWAQPVDEAVTRVAVFASADGFPTSAETGELVCVRSGVESAGSCRHLGAGDSEWFYTAAGIAPDAAHLIDGASQAQPGAEVIEFSPPGAEYRAGFDPDNGGLLFIEDLESGERVVDALNGQSLWEIVFDDERTLPVLASESFSATSTTHSFTFDPLTDELTWTLDDGDHQLTMMVELLALAADGFDMRAELTNDTGLDIRSVSFPHEVEFPAAAVNEVLLPLHEGVALQQPFFTAGRSTSVSRPDLFADLVALDSATGQLGVYLVQDSTFHAGLLPDRDADLPALQPATITAVGHDGSASIGIATDAAVGTGHTWTSPTVRLRTGWTFREVTALYRSDAGFDDPARHPTLAAKLAALDGIDAAALADAPVVSLDVDGFATARAEDGQDGDTWAAIEADVLPMLPAPSVLRMSGWQPPPIEVESVPDSAPVTAPVVVTEPEGPDTSTDADSNEPVADTDDVFGIEVGPASATDGEQSEPDASSADTPSDGPDSADDADSSDADSSDADGADGADGDTQPRLAPSLPDGLPIDWDRHGSTEAFQAMVDAAAAQGVTTSSLVDWTVWNKVDPITGVLPRMSDSPEAARTARGQRYPWQAAGGYVVLPWIPSVQAANDDIGTAYQGLGVGALFTTPEYGRTWTAVLGPDRATPTAAAYPQAMIEEYRRFGEATPLFVGSGFDHLSGSAVGLTGSLRTAQQMGHLQHLGAEYVDWVAYPLAADLVHDKVVFLPDAGTPVAWPADDPALLAHYLTFGYGLAAEIDADNDGWLSTVAAYQRVVASRTFGAQLASIENPGDDLSVLETVWVDPDTNSPTMTITANADAAGSGATVDVSGFSVAADGFHAQSPDRAAIAGIYEGRFNNARLADGVHWLAVDRDDDGITVQHLRGPATDLALPRPPSWADESDITVTAIGPEGQIVPVEPIAVRGKTIVVSLGGEVTGFVVDELRLTYGVTVETPGDNEPTDNEPTDDEPTDNEPTDNEPTDDEPPAPGAEAPAQEPEPEPEPDPDGSAPAEDDEASSDAPLADGSSSSDPDSDSAPEPGATDAEPVDDGVDNGSIAEPAPDPAPSPELDTDTDAGTGPAAEPEPEGSADPGPDPGPETEGDAGAEQDLPAPPGADIAPGEDQTDSDPTAEPDAPATDTPAPDAEPPASDDTAAPSEPTAAS